MISTHIYARPSRSPSRFKRRVIAAEIPQSPSYHYKHSTVNGVSPGMGQPPLRDQQIPLLLIQPIRSSSGGETHICTHRLKSAQAGPETAASAPHIQSNRRWLQALFPVAPRNLPAYQDADIADSMPPSTPVICPARINPVVLAHPHRFIEQPRRRNATYCGASRRSANSRVRKARIMEERRFCSPEAQVKYRDPNKIIERTRAVLASAAAQPPTGDGACADYRQTGLSGPWRIMSGPRRSPFQSAPASLMHVFSLVKVIARAGLQPCLAPPHETPRLFNPKGD